MPYPIIGGMPERPGWREWAERFARSRSGKQALTALEALREYAGPRVWLFEVLRRHVSEACHGATLGISENHRARRDEDAAALRARATQREHIDALLKFIREYPGLAGGAFAGVVLDLDRHFNTSSVVDRFDCAKLLDGILAGYQEELQKPVAGIGCGPFQHRFINGCLAYPEPVESRRVADSQTQLLFYLVFLFRRWTRTKDQSGNMLLPIGARMPTDGRPCYHIAALFCNATLDTNLTTRGARDRLTRWLKDNENVVIAGWPESLPGKGWLKGEKT